jgi:hypothetical protein
MDCVGELYTLQSCGGPDEGSSLRDEGAAGRTSGGVALVPVS